MRHKICAPGNNHLTYDFSPKPNYFLKLFLTSSRASFTPCVWLILLLVHKMIIFSIQKPFEHCLQSCLSYTFLFVYAFGVCCVCVCWDLRVDYCYLWRAKWSHKSCTSGYFLWHKRFMVRIYLIFQHHSEFCGNEQKIPYFHLANFQYCIYTYV